VGDRVKSGLGYVAAGTVFTNSLYKIIDVIVMLIRVIIRMFAFTVTVIRSIRRMSKITLNNQSRPLGREKNRPQQDRVKRPYSVR